MSSLALDVREEYGKGNPIILWKNRPEPFRIGSQAVAFSGKVAIVQTILDGTKGRPILLEYRLARRAHIEAWLELVEDDSVVPASFTTAYDVGFPRAIFAMRDPIPIPVNEILRDQSVDFNQTIFDSTSEDYRKGFDLWRGVINLIAIE